MSWVTLVTVVSVVSVVYVYVSQAQAVLTRTLELRRQLFSAHTHPYADCAALLARVMLEVGGQQDKALQLYSAAVQIVEDTGGGRGETAATQVWYH
jgi:hypothetical protein